MGSIKNSSDGPQSHTLTEDEFNYVMNINQAKQSISQEYTRVMSSFLHYVSSSRLGYSPQDDLQFEVDFTDEKRELKVTRLPRED